VVVEEKEKKRVKGTTSQRPRRRREEGKSSRDEGQESVPTLFGVVELKRCKSKDLQSK